MTTWRDVEPGDTILGRDGNHYVVLARFDDGRVTLWRDSLTVGVTVDLDAPVVIAQPSVERAVEVVTASFPGAEVLSTDEPRVGVLEQLRRAAERGWKPGGATRTEVANAAIAKCKELGNEAPF